MKKRKNGIQIILVLCAALGWWGFLYPELTLTPDTVRIVEETADGEEILSDCGWRFDEKFYLELLNTSRDKIRFRSRLLTELNSIWEALNGTD